ncbi:MAG: hypothetical protein RR199_07890 [Alistipes sp.]
MKRTLKLLAMALMAGAMVTACGGDDNGTPEPPTPPTPEGNFPDVTISNKVSGAVKVGFADAIAITGTGFDPEQDWIELGYEKDGSMVYERVTADVLTFKKTRVAFGIGITATFLDKTVKVYLNRMGYDPMPLTGDITFTMPTVAEGYIPDPAFRATLNSDHPQEGNPAIKPLFNAYGLLDVEAAGKLTEGGHEGYGINLYNCKATSLEGIELFKSVTGLIPAWGMENLKEVDLSKWMAKKVDLRFNDLPKLEKFIGSPYAYRVDVYKCPNLKYVDLNLCKWCYNVQLFFDESPTQYSSVTYLDVRRQRTGTLKLGDADTNPNTELRYPTDPAIDYSILLSGVWMKVAANCHILIDYQYLLDKKTNTQQDGYGTIFSAWQRGATIDVYASKNITKKIGTVPLFSVDPNALTISGENGWKVNDPQ